MLFRSGYGFFGDGGPATIAEMANPKGVAADSSGNIYVADTANDVIREVLATSFSSTNTFSVSPGSLSFSAPAGTAIGSQQISISSRITGLAWTARASTQNGGNWLAVSPASGSVPGLPSVSVDVSNLAPGNYTGAVTITVPAATPPTQTVTIQLTVLAPLAIQLSVQPATLSFQSSAGSNPAPQVVHISNAGTGPLSWTTSSSTASGGNWLAVSPSSGSAPGDIQVAVNSAALTAGVYSGSVLVSTTAANQSVRIPVTVVVSQGAPSLLLSQTGLIFTAVAGVGSAAPQSLGILNTGQQTMNWTASASTLSGGNWLSVSPDSGVSAPASLQIPLVQIAVNPAGLSSGSYSGLIRVDAPGARNSPQLASVVLTVLPAGTNPGVQVHPTGLIFTAQAGTTSPGSQTISITTAGAESLQFVAGTLTLDGGNWLNPVPRKGVVSSSSAATITIQPQLGVLPPGVYQGAVPILFSDNSAQIITVLLVVVPRTAGVTPARLLQPQDSSCVPTRLLAVDRVLGSNFTFPTGWPGTLEAQVSDDCGNAVSNASVVASFSNGDPPVVLVGLNNGSYVGTWRPTSSAQQVTVTMQASASPLTNAVVKAQGQITRNARIPILFDGGVVNAASFGSGQVLAPGSIVSLFGSQMALATAAATDVPLPATLAGASITVGGRNAPLFYSSDGQINAQLPFDISPGAQQQVIVRTSQPDGFHSLTVPQTITLAAARPGIFTLSQNGQGQGAILNAQTGVFADSAAPVSIGNVIEVFATGLGATNPPVYSGQAPPAGVLANVTTLVGALVGGVPANVLFAGLAPGFVGLYQVNVEIPAGVQVGPTVTLVLVQDGVPSNTVTFAIR